MGDHEYHGEVAMTLVRSRPPAPAPSLLCLVAPTVPQPAMAGPHSALAGDAHFSRHCLAARGVQDQMVSEIVGGADTTVYQVFYVVKTSM